MPTYIRKDGDQLNLVEYATEKPNIEHYPHTESGRRFFNYNLENWQKSAVITPFHESEINEAEKLALHYWAKGKDVYNEPFRHDLFSGIQISEGLVVKEFLLYDNKTYAFLADEKKVETVKYRLGKKNKRAILEVETGKEYLVFPQGKTEHVQAYLDFLNEKKEDETNEAIAFAKWLAITMAPITPHTVEDLYEIFKTKSRNTTGEK